MQPQHRVLEIHPAQERPGQTIANQLLEGQGQLAHLLHRVDEVLVLLLAQESAGHECAIHEALLLVHLTVLVRLVCLVGATAVETAAEHHEAVAGLELGVECLLFPWRARGVVPQVGARDEAGGAVASGRLLAGDEEADARVAAEVVVCDRGVVDVVDGVLEMIQKRRNIRNMCCLHHDGVPGLVLLDRC